MSKVSLSAIKEVRMVRYSGRKVVAHNLTGYNSDTTADNGRGVHQTVCGTNNYVATMC